MKKRKNRFIPGLIGLLLAFPMGGAAQGNKASNAPTTDGNVAPETVKTDHEPSFKVAVNVVNVFLNVKGEHNAPRAGLNKEDFEVFEDGVKQNIKYFRLMTDQPLTLGVLVDTSGSELFMINAEKEAGSQFLKEVIRERDLAFLINFDVNVELAQDTTSSVRELRDALDKLKINSPPSGSTGIPGIGQGPIPTSRPRGTALYDAIYLASREKLGSEVGRKAIIILTDGLDNGSKMKLTDAIEAAQRADAICYVILVWDRNYGNGSGEMKKLAETTGGRVIEAQDARQLKQAFDQVSTELRTQYSLGYTPLNAKLDGSFRKLEIKTKAGKVQARRGYYAVEK